MTSFGYTLMTEQTGPRELVRDAAAAEQAGFDFEVMSDHYTGSRSAWAPARTSTSTSSAAAGHRPTSATRC